ncbi:MULTISPECIES: M15 family metallopeptidase [unclassified Leifsonia]|uniref:M15 family metallopeptidase n=1 Tax=unclassified Leifsonia TaxID=2663824 RepID=UPI0006F65732|nr:MULTISPECIES: M15 family metallopeptidase [unclassified Leifsonia]KQX07634.1 peptidase M15 [Leifsonia sp. Root1293]KRA11916.1 peptidase M15 [Leifsonia sp. Root60]
MSSSRTIPIRRIRWALLVIIAAGAAAFGTIAVVSAVALGQQSSAAVVTRIAGDPTLGADGSVPDGVTVFDGAVPAVANLDPDLLDALRRAATDAAADDVTFTVNSGWRSPEYQEQLLRDAVTEYGSTEEAARWVATPETSPHVQGAAIDIGPWDATAWLSENGAEYGLCQIYANESWHFELRPDAVAGGCPEMFADPTADPRMQR